MDNPDRIPGAKELWRQLPLGWPGCWFYFDTILDFQFHRTTDFQEEPRFDGFLLLCDDSETWHIRLTMRNITGNLSLNLAHKISGLDIEDASYHRGYEKTVRYRIADFEDHAISIYCEDLFIELVSPPESNYGNLS